MGLFEKMGYDLGKMVGSILGDLTMESSQNQKKLSPEEAERQKKFYLAEARKYLAEEDVSRAKSSYLKVNNIDSSDWESYFYFYYLTVCKSGIKELERDTDNLTKCLEPVISRVYKYVSEDNQDNAIAEICQRVYKLSDSNGRYAKSEYDKISSSVKNNYENQYLNRQISTKNLLFTLAKQIREYFGDSSKITEKYTVMSYEKGIQFCEMYFATTPESYSEYEDLMEVLFPGKVGRSRIRRRIEYYRKNIDKLEKKKSSNIKPGKLALITIATMVISCAMMFLLSDAESQIGHFFAYVSMGVMAFSPSVLLIIPFVYFDQKKNAGNRINKLNSEISVFEDKLRKTKELYKI